VIRARGTGRHGSTQAFAAQQYNPSGVRSIKLRRRSLQTVCKAHPLSAFVPLATKLLATTLFVSALAVPSSALAQIKIPKAQSQNQCPLGYVNTLCNTCVSPNNYEMKATTGGACPSGWINVRAGYCRKNYKYKA
jgi:hypothetical protein